MLLFLSSCLNPFAPRLDESGDQSTSLITDQSNIDGIFQNMKYAYTFGDTLIYGELLERNFSFTYIDYDKNVNVTWGRDEEMKVTDGLFSNSESLNLVWNEINLISSDSTNIKRSFNLTITFNPTDVIFVDGKVNLTLIKKTNKWKILNWIDESNF